MTKKLTASGGAPGDYRGDHKPKARPSQFRGGVKAVVGVVMAKSHKTDSMTFFYPFGWRIFLAVSMLGIFVGGVWLFALGVVSENILYKVLGAFGPWGMLAVAIQEWRYRLTIRETEIEQRIYRSTVIPFYSVEEVRAVSLRHIEIRGRTADGKRATITVHGQIAGRKQALDEIARKLKPYSGVKYTGYETLIRRHFAN